MPSPPQTKISSAPSFERALDLLRRLAALRHLHPERVGDALAPRARAAARAARRRTSCPHARRPRPSAPRQRASRAAAARSRPRGRRAPSRRARRRRRRRRRATSSGWCMPRYMRANATKIGIATATAQIATRCAGAVRIREVSEQRDPAVDGDRGRGVTREIARIHGQLLEAVDRRAARGGRRASSSGTTADSSASAKTKNAATRHWRMSGRGEGQSRPRRSAARRLPR